MRSFLKDLTQQNTGASINNFVMQATQVFYFSILLIVTVIGAFKYRTLSVPGRFLFLLVAYTLVKEISAFIIAKTTGYNLSFYKYLSPVDFLLTMAVFWNIPTLVNRRLILSTISVIVIVFYFLNLFIWQPPGKGVDSNFKLLRSFFLVMVTLLLFFGMAKNIYSIDFWKNSEFWFGSAILIFYVVNIFYWGVYNYYLGNKQLIMKQVLRPTFDLSNYIFYGFLGIALWFDSFLYSKKGI